MTDRRIVSLALPFFATDRLRRAQQRDEGGPLVTTAKHHGRAVLVAVDAAARAAGLRPGQGLADARALCPAVRTAPDDPAGDAQMLADLGDWCLRYTPWTAPDDDIIADRDGAPGLWLDISGCAHLFADTTDSDGEATLLADLIARLRQAGFGARGAIADTPGAAWAMARFGAHPIAVVPPGGQTEALAPLPAAALRLPAAIIEDLGRLGLRRIGDLDGLPRAALATRFGPLQQRLDQALGASPEPISQHNARLGRPLPPWSARLALIEPIRRVEDVAVGLARLLAELCPRLAREGLGARRLELLLFRTDATLERAVIGTSRPSYDAGHIGGLFAERLAGLEGGPNAEADIELMRLEAVITEPLVPTQRTLDRQGGNPDLAAADLGSLVDRLATRLGPDNVVRLDPVESHLPERAVCRRPALSAKGKATWPGADLKRPIRLLPRPERVRVTASDQGMPKQFDWRRRGHALIRSEGPERLLPEWWREHGPNISAGPPRDYYRVENQAGERFWLYRSGEDWFLHGLFA